jgi:hypothetical protein
MVTYYLQKTLTAAGNNYGYYGTDVQVDLDSAVTKVTENVKKKFAGNIQYPTSRSAYNVRAPYSIIVDIKQIVHTFVITGYLTNDTTNITNLYTGVAVAVTATAIAKKKALIAMAEQGGQLTFAHRNDTGTLTVNILELNFEDTETEVGADETTIMKENEVRLGFTITLQKGQDR